MEDTVGDRSLNNMLHLRLNIIDGSISSCCSIINSPDRLDIIRQANKLASNHGDIEYDWLGSKDDSKKRVVDTEYQRDNKNEQKQRREDEDDDRSYGLQTCEVLIHSVLEFWMYHLKNLKVKDPRVLLHYRLRLEKLKGIQKKLVLVETIDDIFRNYWEGIV